MSVGAMAAQAVESLRRRGRLPPLSPERPWHPGLAAHIASLDAGELAGDRPDGREAAACWLAALHLWNDDLDAAHELVQHMESATGAALHGIMHRREGDYDNAKYWFRQAGAHPAYHGLHVKAEELLRSERGADVDGRLAQALETLGGHGVWNPYVFVDAVRMQETTAADDRGRDLLERLQQLELEAFLRYLEGRLPRI